MGFNLKSYTCEKCGHVEFGGDINSHVCPSSEENTFFNVHEIRTAAFYSKLNQTDTNRLIHSLYKLFKK